jgi:hypothetical protein
MREEIRTLVTDMWHLHEAERVWLDTIFEYVSGQRVLGGAGRCAQSIEDLAKLSIKNVCCSGGFVCAEPECDRLPGRFENSTAGWRKAVQPDGCPPGGVYGQRSPAACVWW